MFGMARMLLHKGLRSGPARVLLCIGGFGVYGLVGGFGVGNEEGTDNRKVMLVRTNAGRTFIKHNHYECITTAVVYESEGSEGEDGDYDGPKMAVIKKLVNPPILKDEEKYHQLREITMTMKKHCLDKKMKEDNLVVRLRENVATLKGHESMLTPEITSALDEIRKNIEYGVVDYHLLADATKVIEKLMSDKIVKLFGARKSFENTMETELYAFILGQSIVPKEKLLDLACGNKVAVDIVNAATTDEGRAKEEGQKYRVRMLVKKIVENRLEREKLGRYKMKIHHLKNDDERIAVAHALTEYGKRICKGKDVCYRQFNAKELDAIDYYKVKNSLEKLKLKMEQRKKMREEEQEQEEEKDSPPPPPPY